MRFSFPRLRPGHIIGATLAYWLGLAVTKLGTPLLLAWKFSRLPPGSARIDAAWSNSVFHVDMIQQGVTMWSGSTTLATVILWMAAPPAALIGAWWMQKESQGDFPEAEEGSLGESEAVRELPASRFDPQPARDAEKVRARPNR